MGFQTPMESVYSPSRSAINLIDIQFQTEGAIINATIVSMLLVINHGLLVTSDVVCQVVPSVQQAPQYVVYRHGQSCAAVIYRIPASCTIHHTESIGSLRVECVPCSLTPISKRGELGNAQPPFS